MSRLQLHSTHAPQTPSLLQDEWLVEVREGGWNGERSAHSFAQTRVMKPICDGGARRKGGGPTVADCDGGHRTWGTGVLAQNLHMNVDYSNKHVGEGNITALHSHSRTPSIINTVRWEGGSL